MKLDGSMLKNWMKRENRTIEWVAVKLSCSGNTVRNILAGKVPNGITLIELAQLMGVQVEDLIPSEAKTA
jgi:hypothetical protein